MLERDSQYAAASTLDDAVVALIKRALASAQDVLGGEFPMRQTEAHWFEKVDDGSGSIGHSEIQESPDQTLWWLLRADLPNSPEWAAATSAIERYMEATGNPIGKGWISDESLAQQALGHYLLGVRSFKFSDRRAKTTCRELRQYCASPEDRWETCIAFDGLTAARNFKLGADVEFHQISPRELRRFGTHDAFSAWARDERVDPHDDWWIATVRGSGPKGTPQAHNQSGELSSRLFECFPLLQTGALRAISLVSSKIGPFGLSITGRGIRWTQLGRGEPTYDLSSSGIRRFKAFWRDYRSDAPGREHYLGLSARWLKTGVERSALEDALVDFVIGLESLLSKPEEQTEIRYRFAVRGAALLAKTRNERHDRFKELQAVYDLRSSVVHGRRVDHEDLETLTKVAEQSLREVWRSYFHHHRDASNADGAIDEIDKRFLQN